MNWTAHASALASLVTAYFASAEAQGYAARTLAGRRSHLCHFLAWCDVRGLLAADELTRGMLERYRLWLFQRHQEDGSALSWVTQANKLTSVRMLLAWARRTKRMTMNPAAELELPKLRSAARSSSANPKGRRARRKRSFTSPARRRNGPHQSWPAISKFYPHRWALEIFPQAGRRIHLSCQCDYVSRSSARLLRIGWSARAQGITIAELQSRALSNFGLAGLTSQPVCRDARRGATRGLVMAARSEHATYRRIAVPLDGTVESEHALRWAITIAQRAPCTIDLVHVKIQPPVATELYGAPALIGRAVKEHRPATMQRLSQLADEIRKRGATAEISVLEGEVPSTLENHFETTAADLIVIARHDRSRLEHLLFGSVADSVSRRTHIPMLIVRPPDGGAVLEPHPEIRQILLPFDGSAFAEQIIPHAATLAQLMQAEITVLGVLEPLAAITTAALDAGPDPSVPLSHLPNDKEAGDASSRGLQQAATALRSRGLPVRTVVLSAARPAHAITVYAEQSGIDLIALTTHGRGALERAIMGSVSEAVLRNARLPILLFRPTAS